MDFSQLLYDHSLINKVSLGPELSALVYQRILCVVFHKDFECSLIIYTFYFGRMQKQIPRSETNSVQCGLSDTKLDNKIPPCLNANPNLV